MRTLIKGGTIVTAGDTFQADVLIEDEKVATIGHGLSADTTIDASGKYVGRRVYRTQELGSAGPNPVYYLDKDLASDNTTTSFTDTTSDTTLATQTQHYATGDQHLQL